MAMKTTEKLCVEIFERKAWIVDQVVQQINLFEQNLATKLLLEGIAPPPWLLDSDNRSRTALNAEDIISEVLSRSRPTVPLSFSRFPVFDEPVSKATNRDLPDGFLTEVSAQNDDLNAGDGTSVLPSNPVVNNDGLALVGVSALNHCVTSLDDRIDEDPSVTSPEDQRDTIISDLNHELALSLARLHRSRSRQKALELRSSSKVLKCQLNEEDNRSGYSGGIKDSAVPCQADQREELNLANPRDTTNIIYAPNDVEIGGSRNKEKGGSIYSGQVTGSKSSARQRSASNLANSSNVVREDDAILTDFISEATQQSNGKNQLSESLHVSQIGSLNCETTEAKICDKKSKEIGNSIGSRRLTRSRSSTPQNPLDGEFLVADGSCDNHKETDISNRRQQARLVDIKKESCGLETKLRRQHVHVESSRRVTRSRSSYQSLRSSPMQKERDLSALVGKEHSRNRNSTEGHISRSNMSLATTQIERIPEAVDSKVNNSVVNKLLFATSNGSHSRGGTELPAERSLPIQQYEEPCVANSTDSSDKEDVVDDYGGRNTRTEPASTTEATTKPCASQDFGRRVTRSIAAASHKALETKSSNRLETNSHEKEPNIAMEKNPSTRTSKPADAEGSASPVKETEIDPDGPVKAHSDHLVCNLTRGGAAEFDVLAPSLANSHMPVEPRQLNFDNVEVSRFSEIPAIPSRNETDQRLVENSPSTLSESPSILANRVSNNFLENSSLPVMEKDDPPSREEEPQPYFFEALVEGTDTASLAINGHVVTPEQEASTAEKAIVTRQFQQSDKNTKEKSPLTGMKSAIKASTPVASVPAKLVPIDSKTETLYSMDCELSKEADFLLLTRPDLLGNQDESMTSLAQGTEDLDVSQSLSHAAEFSSIFDNANVDYPESTQSQTAAKSVRNSSFCSPVEGSLTSSKRRRIDSLDNLDCPPGMKKNSVLQFNKVSESTDFLHGGHSPKDHKTSEGLQVPEDDVAQLVMSTSEVEEKHQTEEHSKQEGLESSSALQCEEVDFGLEDRNTSSEIRYSAGYCEGNLVEEPRGVDPISIVDNGDWQHILEANVNSSCLEDEFEKRSTESFTCREAVMQERKSDLLGTINSAHGSLNSPDSQSLFLDGADDTMPVLEGFILQSDDEQQFKFDEQSSFGDLSLPKTAIERAGILEQLCKSACMKTPATCSSTPYKLHKVWNLHHSVPTGLLEAIDMNTKHLISGEFKGRSHSDSFQSSTTDCEWDIKKPCLSPVRKVWDGIISKSGSSEKRRSLNRELPCINEESENIEEVADTFQEGIVSEMIASSAKRKPLTGIDENLPEFEPEPYADRFSLDSVNTEFSFNGTQKSDKYNPEKGRSSKKRCNKENENQYTGAASRNGKMGSLQNRFSKPKLKISAREVPGFTMMEPKRNNIVSNVTSFIPLVQQKQTALIATGKRDVKVKALEAAEAAKRLAEKKENERKIKKEAMKVERARQEQETTRQLELQKKRKEEERRKKEADMAAKKRQREEEERKEKERKRFRVEEARKQQRENEQKLQAAKEEKVKQRSSVVTNLDKPIRTESLVSAPIREPSYDISPYKCSDDEEDEDEDEDRLNTKFIPSWASKNSISSLISSQDQGSIKALFNAKSSIAINEVLLPRRYQRK